MNVFSKPTPKTAYAPWLARFRLECARAALTLEQSQTLETRLLEGALNPAMPEAVRVVLREAPLQEIPWLALSFGIERAAEAFELTAMTSLIAGKASQLESGGVLSPSVRASLEFTLAELLPNTSGAAHGAARDRLRAVLHSSNGYLKA